MLLSDQGRRNYNISSLKYYEFHKKISTKASKNKQIISSKKYDILVRSYSRLHHEQQQLDSNVPARHGGFTKLLRPTYEFSRPYTVIMAVSFVFVYVRTYVRTFTFDHLWMYVIFSNFSKNLNIDIYFLKFNFHYLVVN